MSVLIRGMEMPTSCNRCPLQRRGIGDIVICLALGTVAPLTEDSTDKRADCPIVPVPKHGRLIDADALKAQWLEAEKRMGADEVVPLPLHDYITNGCVYDLDNAPTIIPAEEGET